MTTLAIVASTPQGSQISIIRPYTAHTKARNQVQHSLPNTKAIPDYLKAQHTRLFHLHGLITRIMIEPYQVI